MDDAGRHIRKWRLKIGTQVDRRYSIPEKWARPLQKSITQNMEAKGTIHINKNLTPKPLLVRQRRDPKKVEFERNLEFEWNSEEDSDSQPASPCVSFYSHPASPRVSFWV
mgnify:CR=1 FL=1